MTHNGRIRRARKAVIAVLLVGSLLPAGTAAQAVAIGDITTGSFFLGIAEGECFPAIYESTTFACDFFFIAQGSACTEAAAGILATRQCSVRNTGYFDIPQRGLRTRGSGSPTSCTTTNQVLAPNDVRTVVVRSAFLNRTFEIDVDARYAGASEGGQLEFDGSASVDQLTITIEGQIYVLDRGCGTFSSQLTILVGTWAVRGSLL